MRRSRPVRSIRLAGLAMIASVLLLAAVAMAEEQPQPPPPSQPPASPAPAPTPPPQAAGSADSSGTTAAPKDAGATKPAAKPSKGKLAPGEIPRGGVANNSNLKEVQQRLLRGPVGQDAIARTYIDKIERSDATPAQINDFAIYLSRRAYFADAGEYLRAALDMDENNPTLWLNLGTVQMKRQRWSDAMSAFKKVIELDPNNAVAYYDLGAAYDENGNYDEAVKNYLYALRLDPSLADPKVNPQVVNNNQRLVVELLAFKFRQGSLGLPMQPIATSAPKAAGTAPSQPAPSVPPAGTEKK